jgi:transposase
MKDCITWVGLDDSAKKINGAAFFGNELIAQRQFVVENNDSGLGRLVKAMKSFPGEVRCVYEAGINGYFLQRYLQRHGIKCEIAAPSLTPRKSGKRVKTDRLDAKDLARYYRSGDLTMITIPEQKQEDLRDLMRAREDALEDLQRSRHRLHRFLARRGIKFIGSKPWTGQHLQWIKRIHFDDPQCEMVLDEYRNALVEKMERLKRFDEAILLLAKSPEYQPGVDCLMALKGIKELTAMTIIAEAIDLRRFPDAPGFMAAIGLVPSERSSGEKEIRGSITRTGNSHLRRVLIESAWHYQHRSVPGKSLQKRRTGIRPEVVEIARKADNRLCKKYWRLIGKGKSKQTAAVAVARELAGFIWAIGQVR